ncbi:TcpD family membrane protein [Ornithinibacillus contaminans]|uniref:TcpD family membrane protein n=1 Tax=Ornithinibacillus contaminans TaxID=694055 RepID=UPI00064D897B|nr:TcpD family membrane protein [Ornithinibacillus contaminans]
MYFLFGLEGVFQFGKEQGQYAIMLVAIVAFIFFLVKRAWIGMIVSLVGIALVSVFIINPELIFGIGETIAQMIDLSE